MRLIDADALIKAIIRKEPFSDCARVVIAECMQEVRHAPTIEPDQKKDIVHNIRDYQIEWLKSHNDIKLAPELEDLIINFIQDTAKCYLMEEGIYK